MWGWEIIVIHTLLQWGGGGFVCVGVCVGGEGANAVFILHIGFVTVDFNNVFHTNTHSSHALNREQNSDDSTVCSISTGASDRLQCLKESTKV